MPTRDTITFVCTANICRSPMAEYLLRHALAAQPEPLKSLKIASAGVAAWAGEEQTKNSVKALKKVGIHPSHLSQPLSQEILDASLAVFCMTQSHKFAIEQTFNPLPPHLLLMRELMSNITEDEVDIADPYGQNLAAYEECRDEMIEALPSLIAFLKAQYKI